MARILKVLSLGHLTEPFHREKYSRYNIQAESIRDNQQGGHDEFAITIMLHIKPVEHRVGRGYRKSLLEDHLEECFANEEVPVCFQSVNEQLIAEWKDTDLGL